MIDGWGPSDERRPFTWGAFLDYGRRYGVEIALFSNYPIDQEGVERIDTLYFFREHEGEFLNFILPRKCTPDLRLDIWMMMSVADRLGIPRPRWELTED